MAYKEDMRFQRLLYLWGCQGSVISARYEFRRSCGSIQKEFMISVTSFELYYFQTVYYFNEWIDFNS